MPTLTASRQAAVAGRFHGLHNRLARRLAAQLRGFFRQQGRRVAARYLASHGVKLTAEESAVVYAYTQSPYVDYLPNTPGQDEDVELMRILEVYLLAMVLSASELAAGLVDGTALSATDIGTRTILAETMNRVRGITETTRRAIQAHITEGQRQGYSVRQVADGVLDDGYPSLASVVESNYRNRVEAIATTETARVQSLGIAETYAMNGVERVLIRDGAVCGWTYHFDPDKANGSVRTVAEYRAVPLSHPYCVRLAYPIVGRGS